MTVLKFFLVSVPCLMIGVGCDAPGPRPRPVDRVDLARYAGKWHEFAKIPNWFQQGCVAATAEYTLRDDGCVDVVNSCHKDDPSGPIKSIRGVARVVDSKSNAKLKVRFHWPLEGNYWIIDLDPDYQWAVVGEPSKKYLWILCRRLPLDVNIYQGILSRIIDHGYDPAHIQRTP